MFPVIFGTSGETEKTGLHDLLGEVQEVKDEVGVAVLTCWKRYYCNSIDMFFYHSCLIFSSL